MDPYPAAALNSQLDWVYLFMINWFLRKKTILDITSLSLSPVWTSYYYLLFICNVEIKSVICSPPIPEKQPPITISCRDMEIFLQMVFFVGCTKAISSVLHPAWLLLFTGTKFSSVLVFMVVWRIFYAFCSDILMSSLVCLNSSI